MSLYPAHLPLQTAPGVVHPDSADASVSTAHAASRAVSDCLAWPFEMARAHYAVAVRAGLVERSLLASARFDQTLTAMEHLALGPWARRL